MNYKIILEFGRGLKNGGYIRKREDRNVFWVFRMQFLGFEQDSRRGNKNR